MANQLIGTEEWSPVNQRGQVFLATHNGEGNALSKTQRSYISFSWGGRDIEEFDLIAVNDGSSYQGQMYASFEDLITNYELLDGQHFWGFHYSPNELTFTLATDGVLEATLQDFRNWFRPGITQELVLAEYPYRAIKARVAEAPAYSLLPFEEKITKIINNKNYETSTTMWRGSITLHFIMDDPFWYSTKGYFDENTIIKEDELKAIIEDKIPHVSAIQTEGIFPQNNFVSYDETNEKFLFSVNEQGLPIIKDKEYYLYYSGTAPEKPYIYFEFKLDKNSSFDEEGYFKQIGNVYSANKDYGELQIGEHVFTYTAPAVFNAYNQAINILRKDFKEGQSIHDLRKAFRDSLNNSYMRMWATSICELALKEGNNLGICDANGALESTYFNNFIICLKAMFDFENENEKNICACSFNSATGEATYSIFMYTLDLTRDVIAEIEGDTVTLPFVLEENKPHGTQIEENSGDMVRSNYIILENKKSPQIGDIITKNDCLTLKSNVEFSTFKIDYKYKYL